VLKVSDMRPGAAGGFATPMANEDRCKSGPDLGPLFCAQNLR
jgi:hypothetical protein